MIKEKVDLVGLHENAYHDKFISAWAHDYTGAKSKFSAIRHASLMINNDGTFDSEELAYEIMDEIDKKLRSITSSRVILPFAALYTYAQTESETARYFGVDIGTIRRIRDAIRKHVKSILKSKLNR